MKKYNELTGPEKDSAVDYALKTLVENIVDQVIFIQFRKYHPALEKAITLARSGGTFETTSKAAYEIVLADNELRAELLDTAEMAAETALYSEATDYIVAGIVK